MPHVLLHHVSIRLMEEEEFLHPLGHEAIKRRRGLALLGAAWGALPNFEHVRGRNWKTALLKETDRSAWSARFHHERPLSLAQAALRPARDGSVLGALGRLALAMGLVSHAALDSVL